MEYKTGIYCYYTTRKSKESVAASVVVDRLKKSGFRYVKMEQSFSDSRESMEMVDGSCQLHSVTVSTVDISSSGTTNC